MNYKPSDREKAVFEAAIKLGALYHQWVGTPVSAVSAPTIEQAIEKSVILQPFVEEITVRLDRARMSPNAFGYSELSGLMFDVEIITRVGFSYCRARLKPQGAYPMMEIAEVHELRTGSPDR
jgi:dihydroneopterin aldolase